MNSTSTIRSNTGFDNSAHRMQPVNWLRNGYIEATATGKMPRPWFAKWGWWLLPLSMLALGASALWGVKHIEKQVVAAAPEILNNANISSKTLEFSADYRNIQVGGVLPPGVSKYRIIQVLENQRGNNGGDIRRAIVLADAAAGASTETPAKTMVPVAPVDINVSAKTTDGSITLTGAVPNRRHRDLLQIAAASAVGASNVNNTIAVLNAPAAASNPEDHIKDLANSLSQINSKTKIAELALNNDQLTGTITTSDPAAFKTTRSAIISSDVTVELAAGNTATATAADTDSSVFLQRELDQLQQEIGQNVLFDKASATLNDSSFSTLNKVVSVLRRYPDAAIEIGGHTDSRSTASYNRKLSQQRAVSVAGFLTQRRIAAERITSVGYGETRPIATNETPEGRLSNRRVEITVVER